MPAWIGPAIEAGASILGGLFGKKSSDKASKRAHEFNMAQLQFQKDMAFNQIQWRTKDAEAAGLHPLFALGASPYNFSPIPYDGGSGGGEYLAQMGQDIGRAVSAGMSARERERQAARLATEQAIARQREDKMFNLEVLSREAQIEGQFIENKWRLSQIARLNQPGTGPGVSAAVNAGANAVSVLPARTTSPAARNDAREAGAIRDYGYSVTDMGGLRVVPSHDVHERIEDNFPQQLGWALSNQILPFFEGLRPPDARDYPLPDWAPRGSVWRWYATGQQFLPATRTPSGRWVFHERPRRRD